MSLGHNSTWVRGKILQFGESMIDFREPNHSFWKLPKKLIPAKKIQNCKKSKVWLLQFGTLFHCLFVHSQPKEYNWTISKTPLGNNHKSQTGIFPQILRGLVSHQAKQWSSHFTALHPLSTVYKLPVLSCVSLCFLHFFTLTFCCFFAASTWDDTAQALSVFLCTSKHCFYLPHYVALSRSNIYAIWIWI